MEKSRGLHKKVLCAWLLFEFVYDFLSPDPRLFDGGYSTLHFVSLYLLARYVRLYGIPDIFRRYAATWYVGVSLLVSVALFVLFGTGHGAAHLNSYTSPFVIFLALMLLVKTDGIRIQSHWVNRIGGASFAVYLFHTHQMILPTLFLPWAKGIYNSYSGVEYFALIICYMVAWYAAAVVIDAVRQVAWQFVYKNTHRFVCKGKIG